MTHAPFAPDDAAPARRRNWWDRNWKWFVPVLVVAPTLCCGGGLAAFVVSLMSLLKTAPPYQMSLERVQADPRVQAALGTPVTAGVLVTGNVSAGQSANLTYHVSGPDGSATVRIDARQIGAAWTFDVLEVTVGDTNERLDLTE